MSAVRVVKAGMLTTIQDQGRWGLQSRGVPVAGPMDPVSHRLANLLVGNDADAATLEVTLLGPQLEFEDERVIAVTGAAFEILVDSKPMPMHAPFVVSSESQLRFGARRHGARAYVAIAGGIVVPRTLGSRSTHLISGMGGIDGRPVRAGDRLPLGDPGRGRGPTAALANPILALEVLQSGPYTIAQNSDRMGFRLEGPPLSHARGADIISDATPLGALQVPASGQPILLMADRQTAGGYPKIATVITADIGIAGQLGPGDTITFQVCTPAEAIAALIAQERALMAVEA